MLRPDRAAGGLGRERRPADHDAKREGDTWVLNGEKRWIGNAPWCDLSIIWARDLADNQVKGFIVENKTTPGFSVEKIENKIALKVVQNGHITLKDCRVPEENRLQGGNSFRDTARVLRMTRYIVGWMATGCQMGAYEDALKYAQERMQFGKPIGSFQLIQDLLAKMLANITASPVLDGAPAQLDVEGKLTDAHAALSKAFCTSKAARRSRGPARFSAATASSPTTTSRVSLRTPRRSTPTKAHSRCRT